MSVCCVYVTEGEYWASNGDYFIITFFPNNDVQRVESLLTFNRLF